MAAKLTSEQAQKALGNSAIAHAIDLVRYSNHVVRRIIGVLNKSDADLMARVTDAMERLPPESFTVKRLDSLLKSVREVNAAAYQAMSAELADELKAATRYELGYQEKLFASVDIELVTQGVTPTQVYAGAMARPMQGRLLKEWQSGLEADRAARVRDAIRMGYVEGQTTSQIVQRVRGTKVNGYADGLLDIDRRYAESVVRTAVSHTAGYARETLYSANDDIIGALGWLSTLDARTTPQCRLRDGLRYTADTHKPIGHNVPWGAGPGKLHFCCRSTSVPILKGMEDLPLFGTRAAKGGQVKATTTYADWLKDQPASVQDEILGPTRGKLFRQGGLSMEAFYNHKGIYYTLDQLREKDAKAFALAGLQ